MILYFAADLLWASKIKGTADALALPCRPVRNPDMLHARLNEGGVRALLLDLDNPDVALDLLTRLRQAEAQPGHAAPRVRVLAFGPHVAKDTLQHARDLGADDAIPRGALDHHLPDILISLAGRQQS